MTARALDRLEALLTGIYDLDTGCRVEDFLVTDRAQLPGECRDAPGDEQLFVAAAGDELCLSLYLDAALLERLDRHDPSDGLDADNLADCWTAARGHQPLPLRRAQRRARPAGVAARARDAGGDRQVRCLHRAHAP